MSSKFFGSKHESQPGSRGKQSNKGSSGGSRTNAKRMNSGIKKTGRGR